MTNKILIDFKLLFNIEFGLIKYIQDVYEDADLFSNIFKLSDEGIISRIRDRTQKNILESILTGNNIDKLQNEILEDDYQDIIEYSPQDKNILEFINKVLHYQLGDIKILCTNKLEENICQKINCKTLLVNKNNIDWKILNNYNVFYMRYIDILFRKDFKLSGKVFYFPSTVYISNLKEKILVLENLYGLSIKYLDLYN